MSSTVHVFPPVNTRTARYEEPEDYYAYVRKADEWVLVHRARCRFPLNRKNGVKQSNTGFWIGPFTTRAEAFEAAEAQGTLRVRCCTYCKP